MGILKMDDDHDVNRHLRRNIMNNMVVLQKTEDGTIYCQQIAEKGIEWINDGGVDEGMWENGGTITLDELEEILDKKI